MTAAEREELKRLRKQVSSALARLTGHDQDDDGSADRT